jgi:hypothetical protein
MSSKEKIIAYLAYKEISQRKFSLKTGLSEGILRAGKDLGVDKIRTIKEQYPDLNMDWVIYDEGEMILNTVAEPTANYENTSVEKSLKQFVFDCIEEYLDTQKKEQS